MEKMKKERNKNNRRIFLSGALEGFGGPALMDGGGVHVRIPKMSVSQETEPDKWVTASKDEFAQRFGASLGRVSEAIVERSKRDAGLYGYKIVDRKTSALGSDGKKRYLFRLAAKQVVSSESE